jgi:hypothetical protein
MSAQTSPQLTRIVKIILDIIFGLLVFSSIALVLLIVLSPLILKGADIPLTASVPVGIGSLDEQQFDVQITNAADIGIRNAFVNQAQGVLQLESLNWRYIFYSYSSDLIIALVLAYSFYLLRSVLHDIMQGDPFSQKNTQRIRRIGYFVLLLGFARPAIEYIAAKQILRELVMEPSLSVPALFNVEFILVSLLILLLGQVWSYGLELQHDQELTI